MRLVGAKKLTRRLERMEKGIPAAVRGEVKASREHLAIASARVCPVDTTRLVSAQYDVPTDRGMGAEVGYRDEEDYFRIVHENLDPDVDWQKPGSGPKFLETPFAENRDRYAKNIKGAARKAARKRR
ncbi:hypothetical protein GBA65_14920 [Rubrobacter marinus]|uniref:Uncharacterized protein n=1 Tax=Rubrobacter marinus TaxID=2653852 RepID=A0A6G8PZD4_9ACTN|nr:hypothetical protein [Rubrobacter marinus]QIN79599.1 hypothetical protein GBA65_14920 [Rubrobacter marinus]